MPRQKVAKLYGICRPANRFVLSSNFLLPPPFSFYSNLHKIHINFVHVSPYPLVCCQRLSTFCLCTSKWDLAYPFICLFVSFCFYVSKGVLGSASPWVHGVCASSFKIWAEGLCCSILKGRHSSEAVQQNNIWEQEEIRTQCKRRN